MIQAVTAEVFKEFTARLAAELAAQDIQEASGKVEAADAERGASRGEAGSSPEALSLLPILLRTLGSWLRRLFGRG
jgi:hypothetical protein